MPPARPAAVAPAALGLVPLYHGPGSVVVLDESTDSLRQLVSALPKDWNVEGFVSAQHCVNYLQQEPPHWEADFWVQQGIVEKWWRGGAGLIPQVLEYWASHRSRYELTNVAAFNHLMAGMDGVEAFGELVGWPGRRVLVTGAYDSDVALQALNAGVIDRFVAKQSSNLGSELIEAIRMLMSRPNPRLYDIWSGTLTTAQLDLLRAPSIAEDLRQFAAIKFAEWIVIGEPFGMLGLSSTGAVSWLQLVAVKDLPAMAEKAALEGATKRQALDIRAGRSLSDMELQKALGRGQQATVTPAFYLGGEGDLTAAIFDIGEELTGWPRESLSYEDWLGRHNPRRPWLMGRSPNMPFP